VAHLAAFEVLRGRAQSGPCRVCRAHCVLSGRRFWRVAAQAAYTGSPILMLLGEKDDNLPVAKMTGYLTYAKAAGSPPPIERVIYPEAYHAWTVPTLTQLALFGEYGSTKQCRSFCWERAAALLVDGQLTGLLIPNTFGACMAKAPGYSMVYDRRVRAKSAAESIGFLKRHLFSLESSG